MKKLKCFQMQNYDIKQLRLLNFLIEILSFIEGSKKNRFVNK